MLISFPSGVNQNQFGGIDGRSWKIESSHPVEFHVVETEDIFSVESDMLMYPSKSLDRSAIRRLVFVDSNVHDLYGGRLTTYLKARTDEFKIAPIPVHEVSKDIDYVEFVIREVIDFGVARRHEPIIAIGGGVLTDIVGFAASIYRRGLPYIRVPTTLMGLIDASIGVKTGVNFRGHKNRIGSYYPPIRVFHDRSFLQSLDRRHLLNGLAEIIKLAIVKDGVLFSLIEQQGHHLLEERFARSAISDMVFCHAIQGMLEELEPNLWEGNLERLVDFGHSFSPSLEMRAVNDLLHGEAVAIDMCISSIVARKRGLLDHPACERILVLIEEVGLPIFHNDCDRSCLEQSLIDCTKHRDGLQRIPLPTGIGKALFFNDITLDELSTACNELAQRQKVGALDGLGGKK